MDINTLIRSSFAVMLENAPVIGKMLQVVKEIEERDKFEKLVHRQAENSQSLQRLVEAVDRIEQNVHTAEGVREIKEFKKHNGFLMLPKILHEDPHFEEFWKNPNEFGGSKEPVLTATPKDDTMSFLMFDMYGEKWVYHIPVYTFGMMLQNRSLKGMREEKALGVDLKTKSCWITASNEEIYDPSRTLPDITEVDEKVKSSKSYHLIDADRSSTSEPKIHKKSWPRKIVSFFILLGAIALSAFVVIATVAKLGSMWRHSSSKDFTMAASVMILLLAVYFKLLFGVLAKRFFKKLQVTKVYIHLLFTWALLGACYYFSYMYVYLHIKARNGKAKILLVVTGIAVSSFIFTLVRAIKKHREINRNKGKKE